MDILLTKIRACNECASKLEFGVRPVVAAGAESKIIIVGQAPGRIVHETGIPWNDKSGENLRNWMGIDKEIFYDTKKISIIPMGFCYPGKGKSGDLPPRPECAPLWHRQLREEIKNIKLILLVGQYAQNYYLGSEARETLTDTVKDYRYYLPEFFPLPHPSPRNNIWQAKNKWFANEVLPVLKKRVERVLSNQNL
ncbi:MAG TPA: uracil-DNA glycosylase family protein [Cytophagaceae bacterium]|nr:uracil-DNA glycosylase family protein [Cytophagaceae bacterium]